VVGDGILLGRQKGCEPWRPSGSTNSRLIVICDSALGKSCLLHHFTQDRFPGMLSPDGDPMVGGKRINLWLWDMAEQDRFGSVTRSYYLNSVERLACVLHIYVHIYDKIF
uniref:Uncharacterized protein n=1 Tax=Monodelphis domestica TaxID=13616 RepID=A0A5F8HAK6_MONDO